MTEGSNAQQAAQRFGDRLRELREGAGLSQPELAEKAGLTRAGVAQFETGRRRPMWESVIALAKALGVDCTSFMVEPQQAVKPGPGRPAKKPPAAAPAVKKPARKKGKG